VIGVLLAISMVLAVSWGSVIPDPRTAVFVVLWLPALVCLALFRWTGSAELLLASTGPVAVGLVVFALEIPTLDWGRPVVNWGTHASFSYLFPTKPPFIGPGGRLRANLRARLRSADYPGGTPITTNADGFRANEWFARMPLAAESRVLSLGDSFSAGYGAAQDWYFGSLLERALQVEPGRNHRVLTAEVSDPAYGLWYLQAHGLAFAPRIVVYGLCGNDVMQAAQFCGPHRRFRLRADGSIEANPEYREGADDLVAESSEWAYPRPSPQSSRSMLRRTSGLMDQSNWTSRILALRGAKSLSRFATSRPAPMPTMALRFVEPDGRLRLIDGYANLGHYYLRDPDRTRELNHSVFPVLRGLHRVARSGGARFVLVVFPQRYQVDPGDWRTMCDFWNLDGADFDLELFNSELADFCRSEGIECLDLLGPFREAALRESLYLPGGDMHFNRRGHLLAAERTAAFLRSSSPRAAAY
jgi:lysophospholipase L1-like esterase